MKPQTFAQLVANYADTIIEGFKSSADNEKYAQVIIDKAIKTKWGASLEHVDFGGVKIREINYPNSQSKGESADFAVMYSRGSVLAPKQTAYFIEIKTESGASGRFSGKSWKSALKDDIEKLTPVSQWLAYQSFASKTVFNESIGKRCFAVIISFSKATTGKIAANYATHYPSAGWVQLDKGNYCLGVLVVEV